MKRAPGFARAAARLICVGTAAARNESIETPAKRSASSLRLAAAICASTPVASATARLHERVEQVPRPAAEERVQCKFDPGLEIGSGPCGHQQRACIQRDDGRI